ncbi:MAG: von Willebrand factor type A domain-containing protein [Bacteroidota bacterium]
MKLKWILLLIPAIVLASYSPKGTIKVKGTVYDHTGLFKLDGVEVSVKKAKVSVKTDADGFYSIEVPSANSVLVFKKSGYETLEKKVASKKVINVYLKSAIRPEIIVKDEITIVEEVYEAYEYDAVSDKASGKEKKAFSNMRSAPSRNPMVNTYMPVYSPELQNNEDYAVIKETGFQRPAKAPLSTFSIDVDAASYSNVRRFLNKGQLPPADAVRIEEMVNYFSYDYPQPKSNDPFSITTEIAPVPWNEKHQLVHIGIQGKKIDTKDLPASNLVFLLDVSGSMNSVNKLPLLKSAFKLLVEQLRPEDKVSIVVYAGAAGLVLEPTSGKEKSKILAALNQLSAGGSTAGGAGIELAYAKAKEHFVKGGNNRIILATDGDFNVGSSSNQAMETLIEKKRNDGIYLTVLGFGMGNYKDSKMEILADKGNGNYAYIDNIQEAKKVLVNEFGGTMFTIAKDVKIQVEFNPENVQAYRLIGYENRILNDEDFNNDKKDAGELGAGHTVTAMYEVIPTGVESSFVSVDPLKYQKNEEVKKNSFSNELMTVKLRYKKPEGDDKSKLIVNTVNKPAKVNKNPGVNFRWSAAVAAYGMLLRDSDYSGDISHEEIITLAQSARGEDNEGYRAEFIRLAQSSKLLAKSE